MGDWLDRDDLLNSYEDLSLETEAWIKLDKLAATLPEGQISGYERGLAAHRSGDIERGYKIWRETVMRQTAPDANSACIAWEYLTTDNPNSELYARESEIKAFVKQARKRLGQAAADALSERLTFSEKAAILAELSSMQSFEWSSKCRSRAWSPPELISAGFDARIPEIMLYEAQWAEYLNQRQQTPEAYRNIINLYRAAGADNAAGRTHAARLEELHFPQARWAGILEDYRLSAEAGHRRAMILYADALEQGDYYQSVDVPAAIGWYRKVVDSIPADVKKPSPTIPKGYRDRDTASDWARQRLSNYAKAGTIKLTAAERQRYLTDEELLPENCAALRTEAPPVLPVSPHSIAVIDSQEWLRPGACEVNVRIEIERPQPNRLVQHITPNWGGYTYPQLHNFFLACVAAHYGTKFGYDQMRYITPKTKPILEADGSFRFEVQLEKSGSGSQTEFTNAAGETLSEPFAFAGSRKNCAKMLTEKAGR